MNYYQNKIQKLLDEAAAFKKEMLEHAKNQDINKCIEAWDKRDECLKQADSLVEFEKIEKARLGDQANECGCNGPIHAQDTEIAHVSLGEIVIPPSAQTPEVMRALHTVMGRDVEKYTVGSSLNQINPVSGLPAFADTVAMSNNPFMSEVNNVLASNGFSKTLGSRYSKCNPGTDLPVEWTGKYLMPKPGVIEKDRAWGVDEELYQCSKAGDYFLVKNHGFSYPEHAGR